MKNHTPDLSFDQEAEIILVDEGQENQRMMILSQRPMAACAVVPEGPLESELELGLDAHGDFRLEQARKDWYVQNSSITYPQDMMPPCNTHLAFNLRKVNRITEGFVVRLSDQVRALDAFKDYPYCVAILELYRSGDKELAARMKENRDRLVTGTVSHADLRVKISTDGGFNVPAAEITTMFLMHSVKDLIGWQYVYQNGQLAKPIRSEGETFIVGFDQVKGQLGFLNARTGAITVFSDTPDKYSMEGHFIEIISSETDNANLAEVAKFLRGRVNSYENGNRLIVCDPVSLGGISVVLASLEKNQPIDKERPDLKRRVTIQYRPTGIDIDEGKHVCEILLLYWKQLGMDSVFNEKMIAGAMRQNGLKGVPLPKQLTR